MGITLPERTPPSLTRRLTIHLIAGASLLFALMTLVAWAVVEEYAQRRLHQDLLMRTEAIIALTEQEEGEIEIDFPESLLSEYARQDEPYYVQIRIWDGQAPGKELLRSPSLKKETIPPGSAPVNTQPVFYDAVIAGRPVRVLVQRFTPPPEKDEAQYAEAVIAVAAGKEETERFVTTSLVLTTLPMLAFFAAMLLGVTFLIQRGLKPLHTLAQRISRIDSRNLAEPIDLATIPLEIKPLVVQLNTLLARLDEAIEHERRFSGNVAHELRTPLAEIKLMCEVHARNLAREDRHHDEEILAVVSDMEKMVAALLSTARLQEDMSEPAHEEICSLAALVERAARRHETEQRKRRITLDDQLPEEWLIITDPESFEIILSNLLGNAIMHAPEGSVCTVFAEQADPAHMTLAITNPAPMLEPGDTKRMFERFWQKDSARTRGQGVGLGLSLAVTLCRRLHLSIGTTLSEGQELTITLGGIKKSSASFPAHGKDLLFNMNRSSGKETP